MKTTTTDNNLAVLEGDLERIAYFNERTHYTIARLKTAASARPVTLVGFMGGVQPGETIHVSGHWETHPKYGQQLRVKTYEVKLPATVQGIRQYLKSGIVKGLGPQLVERLVDRFGADTLSIIEEDPGRLTEVEESARARPPSSWPPGTNTMFCARSCVFSRKTGSRPPTGPRFTTPMATAVSMS